MNLLHGSPVDIRYSPASSSADLISLLISAPLPTELLNDDVESSTLTDSFFIKCAVTCKSWWNSTCIKFSTWFTSTIIVGAIGIIVKYWRLIQSEAYVRITIASRYSRGVLARCGGTRLSYQRRTIFGHQWLNTTPGIDLTGGNSSEQTAQADSNHIKSDSVGNTLNCGAKLTTVDGHSNMEIGLHIAVIRDEKSVLAGWRYLKK